MSAYRKVKSAAKDVFVNDSALESKVLTTMKTISDIVGATLGPAGRPVLIERQEFGLPHMVTKDGVTVFRALGFQDPTAHAIMEAARESAGRTASEAGDGTTTSAVLAEAIVRYTHAFCKKNPRVSAQKVVRRLESVFREYIEPAIKSLSIPANDKILHSVAKLSANGDTELADAVMKCFEIIGDDGNIIINEQSGPANYEVDFLKGFPISMGYEDSCGKFFPLFLNDKSNNRCFMDKPVFVLYFGAITQIQTVERIMQMVGDAWQDPNKYRLDKPFNYNVVLVATGFSETVLGDLSVNFSHPHTINVFPLLAPRSPVQNGELHFLYDLAAVTGAKVFDPMSNPLENAALEDLGQNIQSFEVTRYRSTILGLCDETLVEMRADEVRNSIKNSDSKMDEVLMQERLAKLTSGIAKLKVVGPSSGELREKRDRAEDATFAVRGAKKHGSLPGGGFALKYLVGMFNEILPDDIVIKQVLIPSLMTPVYRIFSNCGMNDEEIIQAVNNIGFISENNVKIPVVYDAWENKVVRAVEGGILDSTPAVLEAIRNSISIASLLGTLGGSIVYKRDDVLERQEASSSEEFVQTVNGSVG